MMDYSFAFQTLDGFTQWQQTASGIIQPIATRYVKRPSGLLVPMSNLEKQAEYFITKYDCIANRIRFSIKISV